MKTYENIIFPTNGPQLWPLNGQLSINTPLKRREISRPKKLRNEINVKPRKPYVFPRKLATVTFHMCGAMGHNKQSCKGNRASDRTIPKGGSKSVGNKNKKAKKNPPVNKKSKKNYATEIESSSQAPFSTQPT